MISEEFIAKVPIFAHLSAADMHVLTALWHEKQLQQGEILFRKGEAGDAMFIIEDGIVEISVPDELKKRNIRVSVLHEGNFLGELSLIDGLSRTASAVAMEDCRLLEMKRNDFLAFIHERPSVAILMISEIGQRLRATNDLVTSLASKNVNVEMDERLSFGDRLADKTTDMFGSWKFIIWFMVFLGVWVSFNIVQLIFAPFDSYPFVFLNLLLGIVSAFQAPLIMMSQNRAQKKDRLRAELDYQVNLKSELMLQQLHAKLEEIRAAELQSMQETLQVELALIRKQMEELGSAATQEKHS
jgi:uncharacterized membrane protein